MVRIVPVSLPKRVNPRNINSEINDPQDPQITLPNSLPSPPSQDVRDQLEAIASSSQSQPLSTPDFVGSDAGAISVRDVLQQNAEREILRSAAIEVGEPVPELESFTNQTRQLGNQTSTEAQELLRGALDNPLAKSKWNAAIEAKQRYDDGLGDSSLTAMTATSLAGQKVTNDPIGVIDFGKISDITGLSDEQLTGVAIADQASKINDKLNADYLETVQSLKVSQEQLAALQTSSFTDFALAEESVRQQVESLQNQLVGYSVSTGDETFDKANNRFIQVLQAIFNAPLPADGTPASEISKARYAYVYDVLWDTVGLGSRGGKRASLQDALTNADAKLRDGAYGDISAVQGATDEEGFPIDAATQIKEQAMNIIRDAFGGDDITDYSKIDPAAWNSVQARSLWAQTGGSVIVSSGEIADAISQTQTQLTEQSASEASSSAAQLRSLFGGEDTKPGSFFSYAKSEDGGDEYSDIFAGAIAAEDSRGKIPSTRSRLANTIAEIERKIVSGEPIKIRTKGATIDEQERNATGAEKESIRKRLETMTSATQGR